MVFPSVKLNATGTTLFGGLDGNPAGNSWIVSSSAPPTRGGLLVRPRGGRCTCRRLAPGTSRRSRTLQAAGGANDRLEGETDEWEEF